MDVPHRKLLPAVAFVRHQHPCGAGKCGPGRSPSLNSRFRMANLPRGLTTWATWANLDPPSHDNGSTKMTAKKYRVVHATLDDHAFLTAILMLGTYAPSAPRTSATSAKRL